MKKSGKSWKESLENGKPYEVKPAPKKFADIAAGEIMLIPSAKIVDDHLQTIPFGHSLDIKTLRQQLATKFNAEKACPVMTGISLRIAAEAACEELEQGRTAGEVTPFWRVLTEKSPSTGKLACGPKFVIERRNQEGI